MKLIIIAWILVLVCIFTFVPGCNAGVAISGSFYAHDYELAQGEEISSNDIYIVVFNKADDRVCVDVEYEAPEFIEVGLSTNSCFLDPDEYERIYITLKAKEDAVPGEYKVKVIAIIKEVKGDMPIKVLTSAAQEADVTVVGEYARVNVAAIDPVGNLASTALIRLFRGGYEMASAEGELEKQVVPGTYTATAYLLGEEAASEEFELAPYEEKRVELPIRSVYFEVFDAQPAKDESGRIGYVYVVAVVKNLYKELPNVTVTLDVSGVTTESIDIYSAPYLSLDRTEIKYNYITKETGKYEFSERVVSDGIVYAVSPTRTVGGPPGTQKPATGVQDGVFGKDSKGTAPDIMSLMPIVAVIAVIIVLVVVFLFYRRRKR